MAPIGLKAVVGESKTNLSIYSTFQRIHLWFYCVRAVILLHNQNDDDGDGGSDDEGAAPLFKSQ